MASSKEYLQFILEQLSALDGVSSRAMMGEYILYYRGKIVGGIYDNRLLVKPVQAARSYLPRIRYETPYEGAKEMLLVEEVRSRNFWSDCFVPCMKNCLRQRKRKLGSNEGGMSSEPFVSAISGA